MQKLLLALGLLFLGQLSFGEVPFLSITMGLDKNVSGFGCDPCPRVDRVHFTRTALDGVGVATFDVLIGYGHNGQISCYKIGSAPEFRNTCNSNGFIVGIGDMYDVLNEIGFGQMVWEFDQNKIPVSRREMEFMISSTVGIMLKNTPFPQFSITDLISKSTDELQRQLWELRAQRIAEGWIQIGHDPAIARMINRAGIAAAIAALTYAPFVFAL